MRIVAGTARGRSIEAPQGMDTRPTLDRVRESLFNILQPRLYDARVLDLFAGSGALAFEALSRGAAFAVLADHDRAANRCEVKNAEKLGFQSRTRILCCDWSAALSRLGGERFDLVLLDPPYAMTDLSAVTEALKPLLQPDALLVVEHPAGKPALVAEGYQLTDSRHYGIAGLSFYERTTSSASRSLSTFP